MIANGKTAEIIPIGDVDTITVSEELAKCFKAVVCYKDRFPNIYRHGYYTIEGHSIPYFEVEALLGSANTVRCFSIKEKANTVTISPYKTVKRFIADKEEVRERIEIYVEEMEDLDKEVEILGSIDEFLEFKVGPMNTVNMYSNGRDLLTLVLEAGNTLNSFTDAILDEAALIYLEEGLDLKESIFEAMVDIYDLKSIYTEEFEAYITKLLNEFDNPVFLESNVKQFDIVHNNEREEKKEEVPEEPITTVQDSDPMEAASSLLEYVKNSESLYENEEPSSEPVETPEPEELPEIVENTKNTTTIQELLLEAFNFYNGDNATELHPVFDVIKVDPKAVAPYPKEAQYSMVTTMYTNEVKYGKLTYLFPGNMGELAAKAHKIYNGTDTLEEAFAKAIYGPEATIAKHATDLYIKVCDFLKEHMGPDFQPKTDIQILMKISSYLDKYGVDSVDDHNFVLSMNRALGVDSGDIIQLANSFK